MLTYSLGEFDKSPDKVLIDGLLHEDATSCEANLALVGEGGSYHCRQTLVEVHIIKHHSCILTTQLWTEGQKKCGI